MSRKTLLRLALFLVLLAIAGGLWALTDYYVNLPERVSQHETIVLGQSRFVPGSQGALRVVVRDSKDASPLEGAEITVALQPASGGRAQTVFTGVTDGQGTADVTFAIPEDAEPNQTLIVETRSNLGSDFVERSVTLERDYRVLLTTDKPLYQPGQVIHLRALALSAFDLHPAAGQSLEITIADGKGNKVFRETLTTSEYGVAAVDFQLASEVNTGPYKITATLAPPSSPPTSGGIRGGAEKTVTVEHYVLPKFAVNLSPERAYYLPGEHVRGTLNATYFFGKTVAGGEVLLEGYTFDFERVDVFSQQGTTDADGNFEFEFDLPDYIAGSDLEGGLGRFYVQASVTDLAAHTETSNLSFPVANSQIVIEAVPEGGQFRPGVENILYVLTSYPDGTPAETSLDLEFYYSGETVTAQTGSYGLAEVRVTPTDPYQEILITARDASGATATRDFYFEGEWWDETVLLRPDRPAYRVGDTMNLTILISELQGTVYLDIVREGQTVSTRAVPIKEGRAEVAVDLTPDLYGTLELHAYKILSWGGITRDTRLVIVDAATDLSLTLTPDREVYRPGETAGLDVLVSGADGAGAQAALGLAVVDESVFALAEQDPGFAKLYFMLEQELLQPKYDLHGFSVPDLITPPLIPPEVGGEEGGVSDPALREAQEGAARASLAEAAPRAASFSLQANSHDEAMQRAYSRQARYFENLSKGLYGAMLILPLAVFGVSAVAVWRERRFGRSLGLALAALIVLPIFLLGLLSLEFLEDFLQEALPFILLPLAFLGLLTLIVIAWRRQDRALGWGLGLLLLFVGVVGFLIYAVENSDIYPDDAVVGWGLAALMLVPLAFLLRSAGFGWNRQRLAALAALAVALLPLMVGAVILAESRLLSIGRVGGGEVFVEEPMLAMEGDVEFEVLAEAPMEEADGATEVLGVQELPASAEGPEPPRLRQFFPETMYWLPDGVTDEGGALHLDIPVADSITTWRLTALASTQDGRLGSAVGGLRVFQDFFIDLDLPLALTVGDEIAVPVGVFNYLPDEQTVRLELEQADWFELLPSGEGEKEITIAANDISVVYFRVRARDFGRHAFKVTAWGSQMSDAIQKEVRVFPNGKQLFFTQSDRLSPDAPASVPVDIPEAAIPGTQTLTVKIYPGILSQVVEGLDSILRMPFGCFEQTSSTTYPNVLVLDYLRSTDQAAPETQLKAEEYINLGYQRLTTFEVTSAGGGFSLFGDPPPDRMLTAYGLQEFSDMSRVHNVDPALMERAAEWLLAQQASDGSWENDRGLVHESTWSSLENDRLPVTAYVVWSLVDAGFSDDPRTQAGLSYVREFQSQADDPYVVALVANALVAADLDAGSGLSPATEAVLDRLAEMAAQQGSGVVWTSGVATFMGSEGNTGSIETTALAALAFLRADSHPDLANAALTTLVQQKDSFGTWYSTQATVLSLKALIESVRAGAENVDATVTVTLNGSQTRTVLVTPENFDVVQLLSFDDVNPGRENVVGISVAGEGNLMYQVSGGYYVPWELAPQVAGPEADLVTIDVAYDRTELAVDDTVTVDVTVTMNEPGGRADWALIDLGLPPGFSVQTEDLAALVVRYDDVPEDYDLPTVERYELTGRQILVYIGNLSHGNPLQFSYRLKAKFPLAAQTPASVAYDYYNPDVSGEAVPQMLVVRP